MRWLLLLLLLLFVPIIEMIVLIEVGIVLGSVPTVALVFFNAIVGLLLLKRQGLKTLLTFNEKLQKAEVPARELVSAVLLVLAGVMLVIPGFVGDIFGFLLLFSFIRHLLADYIIKKGMIAALRQFEGFDFVRDVFQQNSGMPNERRNSTRGSSARSSGAVVIFSELETPALESPSGKNSSSNEQPEKDQESEAGDLQDKASDDKTLH